MTELPHEHFEFLCAMAAANLTSPEEDQLLDQHLYRCIACRQMFRQYEQISDRMCQEAAVRSSESLVRLDASEQKEAWELFSRIRDRLRQDGLIAPKRRENRFLTLFFSWLIPKPGVPLIVQAILAFRHAIVKLTATVVGSASRKVTRYG